MSTDQALEQDAEYQRRFVSEVFHNLSQPLTALHCWLDLALHRDRTVDDLRESIQTALENAERLRQRLLLVRALSDATDPGDLSQPTELNELFRDLQQDMHPLFESAGKKLDVRIESDPILIRGNYARLTGALFCFLEYVFRYLPEGEALSIRARLCNRKRAEIMIAAAGNLPVAASIDNGPLPPYSCEIEMIRRSFRAAGGDFVLISSATGQNVWRATLQRA